MRVEELYDKKLNPNMKMIEVEVTPTLSFCRVLKFVWCQFSNLSLLFEHNLYLQFSKLSFKSCVLYWHWAPTLYIMVLAHCMVLMYATPSMYHVVILMKSSTIVIAWSLCFSVILE